MKQLQYWARINLNLCNNILEIAGAQRNAQRLAREYGIKVLAELIREGFLEPGDNPVECIKGILAKL